MRNRLRRLVQTRYAVSSVSRGRRSADVRVLGDDFGSIDKFDVHDDPLEVVFEHPVSMFERLAFP